MKPTISFCLILKNEEKYIENCLKSIIPVAYEIIIVDTGSTDRTMEICRCVCRVGFETLPCPPVIKFFETKWEDDFSKARNESIKHATGEWIFSIDADERLSEYIQKNLFTLLNKSEYGNKPIVFYFPVKSLQDDVPFYKGVLFRNGFGIHYIRPVNEQLFSDIEKVIFITLHECIIEHLNNTLTKEKLITKSDNYKRILLQQISKNPGDFNNYYYYNYLGNAYIDYYYKNYPRAYEAYLKAIELYNMSGLSKHNEFYGSIYLRIMDVLIYGLKDYKKAFELINNYLEFFTASPSVLFCQAYCYQNLGDFKSAISKYKNIMDSLIENPNVELNLQANFHAGKCSLYISDYTNAVQFFENSYKLSEIKSKKYLSFVILSSILNNESAKIFQFLLMQENLTEQKKNYYHLIKDLPENESRYKSLLLQLLIGMLNSGDTFKDEKKLITIKIHELAPKITSCLIVEKYYEKLEDCLKSLEYLSNEIVIFAKNISDSKINLLNKYAKVIKKDITYPEILNNPVYFSGDWLLITEGNEIITKETQNNLLPFLSEQIQNKINIFNFKIIDKSIEKYFFRPTLFNLPYLKAQSLDESKINYNCPFLTIEKI